MKRLLISLFLVIFIFNICAARKKDKAGEIENGIFYDKDYNYSLVIPEGWSTSVKKGDSDIRLILTKDQYDIPIHFQHAPNYTQVPKVTVYAGPSMMNLDWFVDSLLSDVYKSDQKKDILNACEILYGNYISKRRSKISLGKIDGYLLAGERKYTIQVQRAGYESDKADVVTEFFAGDMFLTEHNGQLIIFHFICERLYYKMLEKEFLDLLNGFQFTDVEPAEEE
nr:hypothetical protein [candidate division Zixibacteria bacterium]